MMNSTLAVGSTAAVLFGLLAVLLFLVNINMHTVFRIIKTTRRKELRMRLVRLSRRMMKWHVKIALAGTALALLHASFQMGYAFSLLEDRHPKMITGLLSLLLLLLTLTAGYFRKLRASGKRRKLHLAAAFIFGGAFVLHMMWPLG